MVTLSRARSAGKCSGAHNLLARCMELAEGYAPAALLLMRILFWMPKATVRRGGHDFVAKSREEWAAEAGISFDQCKHAFAELRRLGLVATEQHKFGGKNVTHVRLTGRAVALLPTAGVGGGSAPPERRKPAPPERCRSAPLSIQGETYRERQQGEDCVLPHAVGLGDESSRDSGQKNSNEPQSALSPAEPANTPENKAKVASDMSVKPDSVAALEEIWQARIIKHDGGFVQKWTNENRGQIGQFRKVCPPGAAPAVLEAVLRDWPLFVSLAKSEAGAWSLPSRPTVAFLVKFAEVAVNLWQAKTKPKVPPTPKPKPQQAPAQPVEKVESGEEKVSLETVMAALLDPPAGGPPAAD